MCSFRKFPAPRVQNFTPWPSWSQMSQRKHLFLQRQQMRMGRNSNLSRVLGEKKTDVQRRWGWLANSSKKPRLPKQHEAVFLRIHCQRKLAIGILKLGTVISLWIFHCHVRLLNIFMMISRDQLQFQKKPFTAWFHEKKLKSDVSTFLRFQRTVLGKRCYLGGRWGQGVVYLWVDNEDTSLGDLKFAVLVLVPNGDFWCFGILMKA